MTGLKMMNCCFVLFALACTTAAGNDQATLVLERSIGRVILASDKYPYGSPRVADVIDEEYETIRKLPINQRVRFFWSVLMNATLDASYSIDFVELIARDCPDAFAAEIKTFLGKNWEFGPPQPHADIAKRTLATLEALRRSRK